MASRTNYPQEYGLAEKEYLKGNFTQAAEIIEHLVAEFPDDPRILLLRGHIYYGFQNYETAQEQYEAVLRLSEAQDLRDLATQGISQIEELQQQLAASVSDYEQSEREWDDFDFERDGEFLLDEEDSNSDLNSVAEAEFNDPFDLNEADNLAAIDEYDIHHTNQEAAFAEFETADEAIADEFSDSEARENNIESNAGYSEPTFMVEPEDEALLSESLENNIEANDADFALEENAELYASEFEANSDLEIDTVLTEPYGIGNSAGFNHNETPEQDGLDYQDELEFDEIDSSFFDLEELEQGLPDTGLFNVVEDFSEASSGLSDAESVPESELLEVEDIEANNPSSVETILESELLEPTIEVKQGLLGGFINSPMRQKQFTNACATGIISAIAVLGLGITGISLLTRDSEEDNWLLAIQAGVLTSVVAGVSSWGTSLFLGRVISKQVEQSTRNLQSQFEDVYQGNLNAKATVYSQDELGRLATGFNRMTRVILTTTQEAQRRAEETEQAKEDLQRQVIRLLDDVEGAARGDLTVQATVTADVLGAVADAFNLTIQSLREIVRQVKQAAEQVNKSSTDSELFARNQSSEALRMAEELAVTLNSVQMMTESIERVAENAREAEEVARSSSVTALKGGKAVESTVAGIFQIRETVSETARKVKRLAEASQEISKIVLLISQIAERTNQLALNASIQAAKAGEAGRGFAVVADEVRQLADRSGKSLKEIEQIVLQIQSETGSVMTAMEEGIQEVIDVTDRAEQAKTALEDIIQVSNRIDTLVRSITADTVEQRENSRAVAQVMQSVELTAQATSQESQRVAGSLQNLVSIARDLLSSVERFRIDKSEQ
ncbi:MAG TPA: methyl-accepting chemotaxis protein [Xenococcaceae cyanobacterium]|jgi:twitching motility protein PilJ